MSPAVRAHSRRTRGGGTTTVRQHHRRGLVSPRHSWALARRALSASRRRRRATALALGGLAVAELAAWLTLTGAALILATAAVLAGTFAYLAASGAGVPGKRARPPERGGGRHG